MVKRLKNVLFPVMAALLTGLVVIMPRFMCVTIFHQPEMPEEINDFRKYDK